MANKKMKMSEGGRSKPDPLAYRIGANIAHKFPREGQTNLHNIPVGNFPDASDESKASMERDRVRRPERIKKLIKENLGTHRAPVLPKAKGGKVTKKTGW